MKITCKSNFMKLEEFKSKDGKKTFHHATFVVDDSVVACKFIKEEDANLLSNMPHLGEVNCDFNVQQSGTDSNGNAVFSFRLAHVSAFVPETKAPFSNRSKAV